jgi:hypothetical protein
MHQRNQPQPVALGSDQIGHCAEREPVDQHPRAVVDLGQRARGIGQRRLGGHRKAGVQAAHPHLPAQATQPLGDVAIVERATGGRVDITG